MAVCYVGLGSNMGDRRRMIAEALRRMRRMEGTRILKASACMETAPVGGPKGQGKYLNAAAKISTQLTPLQLLRSLKAIEKHLGRKGPSVRWGPRPIDLDILLYGSFRCRTKMLTVPHPRMFERGFVLEPLSELIW